MSKKTKLVITGLLLLVALIFMIFWVTSLFGPSSNSIIKDINKIGIENLKSDADILFAQNKADIPEVNYPENIAKLQPGSVRLIHDNNIVLIVLKEFNGTTESGIYIYRDKTIPKRKYEIKKVEDRVSIYKKFD